VSRWTVTRTIAAPVPAVFATVADISRFSQAIPHIVRVEFLSDRHVGAGTRFRETRLLRGREACTELEVTEWVENDHVRLVAGTHGTTWDSVFTVTPSEGGTTLTLVMDGRASSVAPRIMMALIHGMVRRALEHDMDSVKLFCERGTG
jgi:hypothetical protein